MTCHLAAAAHAPDFLIDELVNKDRVNWNVMTVVMLNENVMIGWDVCFECDGWCDYYGCFDYTAHAVKLIGSALTA